MQVGHVVSLHSGAPERLCIQDASGNQAASNRGETQGAIFFNEVVMIGGVPVEKETAKLFESMGELPSGTVESAPASLGWSPVVGYAPDPPVLSVETLEEHQELIRVEVDVLGVAAGGLGGLVAAESLASRVIEQVREPANPELAGTGIRIATDDVQQPTEGVATPHEPTPSEIPADPGHAGTTLGVVALGMLGGAGFVVATAYELAVEVGAGVRVADGVGEVAPEHAEPDGDARLRDEDIEPDSTEPPKQFRQAEVPPGAPPGGNQDDGAPAGVLTGGEPQGGISPEPGDGGLPVGGLSNYFHVDIDPDPGANGAPADAGPTSDPHASTLRDSAGDATSAAPHPVSDLALEHTHIDVAPDPADTDAGGQQAVSSSGHLDVDPGAAHVASDERVEGLLAGHPENVHATATSLEPEHSEATLSADPSGHGDVQAAAADSGLAPHHGHDPAMPVDPHAHVLTADVHVDPGTDHAATAEGGAGLLIDPSQHEPVQLEQPSHGDVNALHAANPEAPGQHTQTQSPDGAATAGHAVDVASLTHD